MSRESIWNGLRQLGFNEYATAGIMANIQAESAYIPNRVQMGYGWSDAEYTNKTDNGSYTENNFIYDAIGYGLCQWTYQSRKKSLYDLAKRRGVSIGDEKMQLDLLYYELTTGHASTYKKLCNTTSAYDAGYIFCIEFEIPADTVNQAIMRGNIATQIYSQFSGTEIEIKENEEIVIDETEATYVEGYSGKVHIVKYGDKGNYVCSMQFLLKEHGYDLKADADYGPITSNCLKDFQSTRGLDDDGICGELTWSELVKE